MAIKIDHPLDHITQVTCGMGTSKIKFVDIDPDDDPTDQSYSLIFNGFSKIIALFREAVQKGNEEIDGMTATQRARIEYASGDTHRNIPGSLQSFKWQEGDPRTEAVKKLLGSLGAELPIREISINMSTDNVVLNFGKTPLTRMQKRQVLEFIPTKEGAGFVADMIRAQEDPLFALSPEDKAALPPPPPRS